GGHHKECSRCGSVTETEEHIGGAASCTGEAVCTVCDTAYGEVLGHDYGDYVPCEGGHRRECGRCGSVTETETHTGGEASCTEQANCEICGEAYGEVLGHNYGEYIACEGGHHRECSRCDSVTETEAHLGGEATCADIAVCEKCNTAYGELAEHSYGHWISDENGHYKECSVCHTETEITAHSGGTATCLDKAVCEVCQQQYGELTDHNYSGWSFDENEHYKECTVCHEKTDEENHSEGTANCTEKAICQICGVSYGEALGHDYSEYTACEGGHHKECSRCGSVTGTEPHTGGAASCTDEAVCTVCNTVYGEALGHDYGEYVSCEGGHRRECSRCGSITATEPHSGGEATCIDKAICEDCNAAYGDLAEHSYGGWVSNENGHYKECSVCHTETGITAHIGGTATCTELAECEICHARYGAYTEHSYDINGLCTVCGASAAKPPETDPDETDPVTVPSETDPITVPSETDPVTIPSETDPVTIPSETDPVTVPSETESVTASSETEPVTVPSETEAPITISSETEPAITIPAVITDPDASDITWTQTTEPIVTSESDITSRPQESNNLIAEVKSEENAIRARFLDPLPELAKAVLSMEERSFAYDGGNVKIILNLLDSSENVPINDKAAVDAILKNGEYVLIQYLDISLLKIVDGAQTKITNTNKEITIEFELPEELRNEDSLYSVIRVHNDESAILEDLDDSKNTVTIKTNKFSTYALVQTAKEKDTNQYTADTSYTKIFIIIGVSAAYLFTVMYYSTGEYGMSEDKKNRMVKKLIAWGKKRKMIRTVPALAAILAILVFYYTIGQKTDESKSNIIGSV
ncbi:MAG: hypothetical protein NC203_02400, partial [Firmicutes bacterium]|nr:hypothetical protein [Bacillota bacterium]